MTIFNLLKPHTTGEHADSIFDYAPHDRTFTSMKKEGSVQRNFALGLGEQLKKFEATVNTYTTEIAPDDAQYLMPEWERMLSIPDSCFSNTVPLSERRNNALVKLARMNAQTANEFEVVALLMGFVVTVFSGIDAINPPNSFVIPEITNDTEARFSIVVTTPVPDDSFEFPGTFPLLFGGTDFGSMQCVLQKMTPANCQIIFIEVP